MLYEEVFRKISDANVQYSVAGGVALVLHGVVRLTADIDLIVKMSAENLQKFIAAMNELGYRPKPPVKVEDLINPLNRKTWKEEKGMEVFSFIHTAKPMNLVDIFLHEPISFDEIKKEMVIFEAKDIKIPVISKNHLVFLKRKAHRPQDIADIEALEALEQMEKDNG